MPILGCGIAQNSTPAVSPEALVAGKVHGGQQPVTGATVTLYAPGTTGYGSAPAAIVTTTTDANGNFTLPRPYTCPAGNGLVYILSTGGNSGAGANASIALAAVLGPCSSLTTSTYIFIDEVTTVAAAYALAPFATLTSTGTSIGTSATNLLGLTNAAGPATNLANTSTGIANGATSNPNMVLPQAEVNTLANILAACVNTNVAPGTAGACTNLFTGATPPGGAAPIDTFQAAIDIALNPGNNNATLFALSSADAPFQPTLSTAPGDFALGIQYIGGQIFGSGFTTGMAIDSVGNAWVGNGLNPPANKSVSKISPAGIFLSPPSGYLNGTAGGNGYSVDSHDNVFIAVAGLSSIYELSPSGGTLNAFTPASLIKPTGLAVDNRTGLIWASDTLNTPGDNGGNSDFEGTTVTAATSTGTDSTGSPYGGNNGPFGLEIDGLGDVWVANSAANTTSSGVGSIVKYTPPVTAGQPYTGQTFTTGAGSVPFELAFDSTNEVYVTLLNTVGKYSNAGGLLATLAAAPTNGPTSVMVDGLGRVFVSNYTDSNLVGPGSLTVFSPTGTLLSTANGLKGYLANKTINNEPFAPTGLGIDPSGNVWITGINTAASAYGYVTELIGIAAPVVTPTSVASSTNRLGARP